MNIFQFGYWVDNSPAFVLEQSAWAARLIETWIDTFGKEATARMIREAEWVDPAASLLAAAWGA